MNWRPDPETWRRRYHEDGYVVVENVIGADLLSRMAETLERIEREVAAGTLATGLRRWVTLERDQTHRARADSDTIANIMELPLFDPVFRDLIIHPHVLDVLEALFESSEFSFHNLKSICKMPGGQAPFRWHRDLPFLPHTSSNLITCMLCVDPMTASNGGTVVFPGSHLSAPEQVRDADRDLPESQLPADEGVTVECPAGSAVLFHTNIIHGGGPNLTSDKRRNVISIWAGPEVHPTTAHRYAYEFVMPRSRDRTRQRQVQMTFGSAAAETAESAEHAQNPR